MNEDNNRAKNDLETKLSSEQAYLNEIYQQVGDAPLDKTPGSQSEIRSEEGDPTLDSSQITRTTQPEFTTTEEFAIESATPISMITLPAISEATLLVDKSKVGELDIEYINRETSAALAENTEAATNFKLAADPTQTTEPMSLFSPTRLFNFAYDLFTWPFKFLETSLMEHVKKLMNVELNNTIVPASSAENINDSNASIAPDTTSSFLAHKNRQRHNNEVMNLPNSSDIYARYLGLSILFYESQRSGVLPANQRIRWRKSANLNDGYQIGRNLSGGYYDAGDFIKFGLPGAYTASLLGWAAVDYASGLYKAKEWNNNMAAIRWATDYYIKCHIKPNEFVIQVGDPKVDHTYWGSPEDMPASLPRPIYVASPKYPGTEPTAEAAAALAAATIAFSDKDPAYSALLIRHSKQLYHLASHYTGIYQRGITRQTRHGMEGVKDCYESSGYYDELAWAAVWLYRATKQSKYLKDSEAYFSKALLKGGDLRESFLSWDDKSPAVLMLLARHTGNRHYIRMARRYTHWARTEAHRTPGGLLWIKGGSEWGSTSVALSTAFLCAYYDDYIANHHTFGMQNQVYNDLHQEKAQDSLESDDEQNENSKKALVKFEIPAENLKDLDVEQNMAIRHGVVYRKKSTAQHLHSSTSKKNLMRPTANYIAKPGFGEEFIKQQIDYVLGKNPAHHSYVVGADYTSPQRVHHAAAQGVPKGHGWRNYVSLTPNRHILYGALVGGPDKHDVFIDRRDDYRRNEPALDYNAPLVLLLARMNAVKKQYN
ncbi:Six-hairpin glycosidase-like protein [Syncephalis fuscata]|nr:Six-hairpin glycosidase-like protein [Syncephalis fuscata]